MTHSDEKINKKMTKTLDIWARYVVKDVPARPRIDGENLIFNLSQFEKVTIW